MYKWICIDDMGMVWHGNINPLSYLPLKCQDSKLIQGGSPRPSTIFRDVALPRKPAWSNKAVMQATYSRDSFCSKTLGWFGWFIQKRDSTTHIYKDHNAPQYKDALSTKSTKKDFKKTCHLSVSCFHCSLANHWQPFGGSSMGIHGNLRFSSPKPPRNSRNSSPCKVPSRDRLVASWKLTSNFSKGTWRTCWKEWWKGKCI